MGSMGIKKEFSDPSILLTLHLNKIENETLFSGLSCFSPTVVTF